MTDLGDSTPHDELGTCIVQFTVSCIARLEGVPLHFVVTLYSFKIWSHSILSEDAIFVLTSDHVAQPRDCYVRCFCVALLSQILPLINHYLISSCMAVAMPLALPHPCDWHCHSHATRNQVMFYHSTERSTTRDNGMRRQVPIHSW
jgi:hypothetical protein